MGLFSRGNNNRYCTLVVYLALVILGKEHVVEVFSFQQSARIRTLPLTRNSIIRKATPETVPQEETVVANGHSSSGSPNNKLNGDEDDNHKNALGDRSEEQRNDNNDDGAALLPNEKDAFTTAATNAAICLLESDMRRDAIGKDNEHVIHTNSWIQEASSLALQELLDQIKLKLPDERTGLDRDEASSWIRWMKSSPTPLIINLSDELRDVANRTTMVSDHNLELIDQTRSQFLSRLGCRLILLPSGAQLDSPLSEAPTSVIYGKLLYGGVSRYRLLGQHNNNTGEDGGSNKPPRKAGERTEVKPSHKDNIPVWMQYGGPDRMYEAMDMGPAAILEMAVMPRHSTFANVMGDNMVMGRIAWKPQNMFDYIPTKGDNEDGNQQQQEESDYNINGYTPVSLSGRDRNDAFQSEFRSTVGGLQPQIDSIVRRVLDGRIIRPAEDGSTGSDSTSGDSTTAQLSVASMEAEELALLGLTPVRGLLMYGPPGCGKTALAREISRALKARAPKIVSAPELLDRWVGGSEKLVRTLFADAESELAACNGDASKSALHVIVIDEIDAVFRKRSSAEDSGEATRSSVVNQILSKLDGVNAIPNVLMIGMTNRRELLDEALLRPGRLEVQVEIPLPDREGRREILKIHFDALRKRGRLSQPLCKAIDGVPNQNSQYVDSNDSASGEDSTEFENKGRKRRAMKRAFNKVVDNFPAVASRSSYDLAADYATGGFSGADIAGLVRCAGSIALSRSRKDGNGIEGLLITLEDVIEGIEEVRK